MAWLTFFPPVHSSLLPPPIPIIGSHEQEEVTFSRHIAVLCVAHCDPLLRCDLTTLTSEDMGAFGVTSLAHILLKNLPIARLHIRSLVLLSYTFLVYERALGKTLRALTGQS